MLSIRPTLSTIHELGSPGGTSVGVQVGDTTVNNKKSTRSKPLKRKRTSAILETNKPVKDVIQFEKSFENIQSSFRIRPRNPIHSDFQIILPKPHKLISKSCVGKIKISADPSKIEAICSKTASCKSIKNKSLIKIYQQNHNYHRKLIMKNQNTQTHLDGGFMQSIETFGIPLFKCMDNDKLRSVNLSKKSYFELASLINRFIARRQKRKPCSLRKAQTDDSSNNLQIISSSRLPSKIVNTFSSSNRRPLKRSFSDDHHNHVNLQTVQNKSRQVDFPYRLTKSKSLGQIRRSFLCEGSSFDERELTNSSTKLWKYPQKSYRTQRNERKPGSTVNLTQTNANGETTSVSSNGITYKLNSKTGDWMFHDFNPTLSKYRYGNELKDYTKTGRSRSEHFLNQLLTTTSKAKGKSASSGSSKSFSKREVFGGGNFREVPFVNK